MLTGMTSSAKFLGFLVLTSLSMSCSQAQATPFEVGKPVPQISLADLGGQRTDLHERRGKVVVVDFWATWCGPCHLQAEILKALHEDYRGRGVEVYGLNVGEDRTTVGNALRVEPLPYTVLLDPKEEVSNRHEILGLPSLLVIGKDGRVAYFMTGLVDGPTLRRVVDQALAG
jgi:thiol-disulfide isomerase/thioredoxin